MAEDIPSDDGRIVIEQRGHILLIGLDRVPKLNGVSEKMFIELAQGYDRMERDAEIRAGVLYAFGPHFSAGIQLDQLQSRLRAGLPLAPLGLVDPFGLREPLRSKPMIAAVQGLCLTVTIELMLATDIVIAASDCRFGQIEVKRGIFANHGATLRMVERAGWGNAMRYLLTGDEFDAETAFRLGMVQEIVSPGVQLGRAIEIAELIAAQAPLAVRATLANARRALVHGVDTAIRNLGPLQQRLFASEDAEEGIRSFQEKRLASFKGR
jgi:enoyl-CoA hydratase/carnithine racemase